MYEEYKMKYIKKRNINFDKTILLFSDLVNNITRGIVGYLFFKRLAPLNEHTHCKGLLEMMTLK